MKFILVAALKEYKLLQKIQIYLLICKEKPLDGSKLPAVKQLIDLECNDEQYYLTIKSSQASLFHLLIQQTLCHADSTQLIYLFSCKREIVTNPAGGHGCILLLVFAALVMGISQILGPQVFI
jgi:hypothetical protein